MGNFLRENWLWIVVPIFVVVAAVVVIVFMTNPDETAPFTYNVW